ncbi:unnamed protein product [Cunninghamella blakesleeana]
MKQVIIAVWMMALVQVGMCYLAGFASKDCSGLPATKFSSLDCDPTGGEYASYKIIKESNPEVWYLYKDDTCSESANGTLVDNRNKCHSSSAVTAVKRVE